MLCASRSASQPVHRPAGAGTMTTRPQAGSPQPGPRPGADPAGRTTARDRLTRRRRQQRLLLVVLLGLLSVSLLAVVRPWAAFLAPAPAAPRSLRQQSPYGPVAAGQALPGTTLTLSFAAPPSRLTVIPDVEVVALGRRGVA